MEEKENGSNKNEKESSQKDQTSNGNYRDI